MAKILKIPVYPYQPTFGLDEVFSFFVFLFFLPQSCMFFFQTTKHRKLIFRGEVEESRLEAKDTKKIRGQGQGHLSEDRPSRGQGQESSRTKDTAASVLQKRGLEKSFSGNLQFIGVAKIFGWRGPNYISHAMTSSKIFKRLTFCGAKIS